MPRFFFHTADGHDEHDEVGTELQNLEAAKLEAARIMGDMLRLSPRMFWNDCQMSVTVADENDLTLFRITSFATESAPLLSARNGRSKPPAVS
jgi:hypothetical protein